MSVTGFRASILALVVAGCATAGDGTAGGADARLIPLDDAGNPILPDAGGPGTPDSGGPGTPDASNPGTPDSGTPAMCTLVPNSGCGAGMACDLSCSATSCTTDCRSVTTAGTDTSTCPSFFDCAAGYVCLGATPSTSSCHEYCSTDSQCMTGPGGLCVIQIVFGSPPMDVIIDGMLVKTCSRNCNPITGTGCPSTWGCHVYQEAMGAMRFFTDCTPPGPMGQGGSCTSDADCQGGFTCVNDGVSTFCAKNCRYNPAPSPSDCLAGTGCVGLTSMPTIAGQEYGVCI